MMTRKSTVAALSILVAVATAHPYAEWNLSARYRWNDLLAATDEKVGARIRSQTTVEMSSCATVNMTTNGMSYRVRICSADQEDYPKKVCLETRVNPCCDESDFSLGNLVSSTQVSVAGEDVTVAYYQDQLQGARACFRLDDAHLGIETCSQPTSENNCSCTCLPPCLVVGGTTTCDKNQTLYFYIDATASNTFENFCPIMVVLQMLVAAFNPSATSGTKIGALLFSDNAKKKRPSPVFDVGTSCFDAVQGPNGSLLSLLSDFGVCLDNNRNYTSMRFPSLCGDGTSAVKGLQEIHRLALSMKSTTKKAILMLTDGIILDDKAEREKVLSKLNSTGVTLIAAGYGDSSEINKFNLTLYTSEDNILFGTDAVQLAIGIVNKIQERGIICQEHADNITQSLMRARGGDLITPFCNCHREARIILPECKRKLYPTCGGSLSFGLPNLPPGLARTEALEYMNQLLIEEEILAAVEKVLEQHHG